MNNSKKRYEKPILSHHGSIEEITKGGAVGAYSDTASRKRPK